MMTPEPQKLSEIERLGIAEASRLYEGPSHCRPRDWGLTPPTGWGGPHCLIGHRDATSQTWTAMAAVRFPIEVQEQDYPKKQKPRTVPTGSWFASSAQKVTRRPKSAVQVN